MKTTIYDKIRQRRIELGLSQDELAQKMGYKSRSTINKIESGKVDISRSKIALFAKHLNISPSYLMGWEDSTEVPQKNIVSNLFAYPFIPYAVSAGALSHIEPLENYETIDIPDMIMGKYARNKSIVIMRVNGESMNRVISHESIIGVKTDIELTDLHDGDIVVVANAGEYTVKRFYNDTVGQRFIFRPDSDSPAFTDIIFSYDNCDDLKLIGKVVMYNVFI